MNSEEKNNKKGCKKGCKRGCLISITTGVIIVITVIYLFFEGMSGMINAENPTVDYNIKEPLELLKKYDLQIDYNKNNILYELVMENKHPSDRAYFYKVAIKLDKDIILTNKLPFNKSIKEGINEIMLFNRIKQNFNIKIKRPNTSDLTFMDLKVYSKSNDKILLPLKKGSYEYERYEKNGYYFKLTIYDKSKKILYYEYQYTNY